MMEDGELGASFPPCYHRNSIFKKLVFPKKKSDKPFVCIIILELSMMKKSNGR